MPSIPLVGELGAKAAQFRDLQAATAVPTNLKGISPLQPKEALFSEADTRAFVRVRPVLPGEPDSIPIVRKLPGMSTCVLMSPKISLSQEITLDPTPVPVDGTFGHEDDTAVVYDTACQGLVRLACDGGSASLICYGQTGSGKTFTTTGLLRCMAREVVQLSGAKNAELQVTVIEVRSECNIDLLTGERVNLLEDSQGKMTLQNASTTPIKTPEELLHVITAATAARATKATARNATSSRSHMLVRLTIKSRDTSWATPGVLCMVDLAGSENTSDSATHDKERQMETKFINSSLMVLKDCIRARATAASSEKHVHIPYRQSQLTFLLKDTFELMVKRPTKTAVIACVSPLLQDARHTCNTLRYASLLYVSPKATVIAVSEDDPNGFSRERCLEFLIAASRGRIKNPEAILPEGDGRAMTQIPETEFIRRATELCGLPEKSSKMMYLELWKLVVDARTANRKNMMKVRTGSKYDPMPSERPQGGNQGVPPAAAGKVGAAPRQAQSSRPVCEKQ